MLNQQSSEVKKFIRAAAVHREGAEVLLKSCPERGRSVLAHEVIYLSGYVVECALKALLLNCSPKAKHPEKVEWLKAELKHYLEKLKHELSKKGVELPDEQKENLKRVRSPWSPEMRYQTRLWSTEEATRVFVAAEGIFDWVNRG